MMLCPRTTGPCLPNSPSPHPGNTVMLPFDIWHQAFINDADVYLARWSYAQLSRGPCRQIVEPLNLTKFYALDMPRSYLIGDEDVALPPGDWGWHPRMSSRLGPHRLVQMQENQTRKAHHANPPDAPRRKRRVR
jgi:hypothetical protein